MKIFDWKKEIKEEELNIVIENLQQNNLVILPTETVYGLGANAYSNVACKKIFTAKGRASDNPLIVHVSDFEMLYSIVEKPTEIEKQLIEKFMPGPFTIILKRKNIICDSVTNGGDTVGVRMPINKIMQEVISKSNIPIAAPSANISGKPSGTNVEDIVSEFEGKVEYIIDGGKSNIGIESTVVKVIDGIPTILRPGFVTEEDIEKEVGVVKISEYILKKAGEKEKVESPGMKYKHYSPRTKCILIQKDKDQINKINKLIEDNKNKVCVLGYKEDREYINISNDKYICLGSRMKLKEVSQNIFSSLRKIDELNVDMAIIQGLDYKNLGLSIMNRLIRACDNNIY